MFCNFALLLLCRLPYFAMSVIIMLLFCVIFLFLPWPKVAFIAIKNKKNIVCVFNEE